MAKFDGIFKETPVRKAEHPRRETKWIHYTKLVDNGAQYCNEKDKDEIISLAGMIDADREVLQNLLVRRADGDTYEIISGHKRRRACAYLVEEGGKREYEFLPCTVQRLSDVQAEFQLYSSNSFHDKTDYEKMHELERMKALLEEHPEEFPHINSGRMVERLAKLLNMKRSTVGEYLTISKNLCDEGKEEFQAGRLKKSAAVAMAGLPKEKQAGLIRQGTLSHKEIREARNREPKGCGGQEPPDAGGGGSIPAAEAGTQGMGDGAGSPDPETGMHGNAARTQGMGGGAGSPDPGDAGKGSTGCGAGVPPAGIPEAGGVAPGYGIPDVRGLLAAAEADLSEWVRLGLPERGARERRIQADALRLLLGSLEGRGAGGRKRAP